MFQVADKVLYPMHGAGVIDSIEEREILGSVQQYYVMHLPIGDLSVMIPTDPAHSVGLRPIISAEEAKSVLKKLPEITFEVNPNWSKRYRENLDRLRTGDVYQVAGVLKVLMLRDRERGLSTGERKMLVSARQILISELVLALHSDRTSIEKKVERAIFAE